MHRTVDSDGGSRAGSVESLAALNEAGSRYRSGDGPGVRLVTRWLLRRRQGLLMPSMLLGFLGCVELYLDTYLIWFEC
jgi:hypothetical protein